MYVLTANITIISKKTWIFEKVQSVTVERDINSLTDTCTITLPRKVRWKDEPQLPIKVGDSIIVRLGYNDKTQTVYCGYITSISAKGPLEIKCEDEMFLLKSTPAIPNSYKSVRLETLLGEQKPGMLVQVYGVQSIGAYRVTAKTMAELLNDLKKQGVQSFFRYDKDGNPTLYSGVTFDQPGERVQVFDNRINMITCDKLQLKRAGERKIHIKALGYDSKNKEISAPAGDDPGENVETRTIYAYNKTQEELQAWADQELARLRQDGLTGSFTTFGACLLDKLDVIGVVLDGEKQGEYQVAKNTITYNDKGFRQEVTLGKKVKA